jgi:hypothetical protein
VALGSDFSFGIRSGALEAAAAVAKADADEHHHFPYARRLRLGWRHDADGHWASEAEDERRWEVFCAECGDTDGPAENQAEPIRHLRGPYSSEHKAKHVAKKHFDDH